MSGKKGRRAYPVEVNLEAVRRFLEGGNIIHPPFFRYRKEWANRENYTRNPPVEQVTA
jgi:hypothetical protein